MGNRPICFDAAIERNHTSQTLELGILRVGRLHRTFEFRRNTISAALPQLRIFWINKWSRIWFSGKFLQASYSHFHPEFFASLDSYFRRELFIGEWDGIGVVDHWTPL
jgi:hypothetical protein